MEVLYEYTKLSDAVILPLLIVAAIVAIAILFIVDRIIKKKYLAAITTFIIAAFVTIISFIWIFSSFSEHLLKVKIDDSVTWNELSSKYDFIGNEGNITILKEKEIKP